MAIRHLDHSEQEAAAAEAKLSFVQEYENAVLGIFDRLIESNPQGKDEIRAALNAAFQEQRALTTKHTSTIGGLVGNISASEKTMQRLSQRMIRTNEKIITYLQELTQRVIEGCPDDTDLNLETFTEHLRTEIHRINPLGGGQDSFEENKLIGMYLDRLEKNHESIVSETRHIGNHVVATAPENDFRKPNWGLKILYAIPLTALIAETALSTQGVGQRFLTNAESAIHGDQATFWSNTYQWLQDHNMLTATMYGTAFAASVTINKLLQVASSQISTIRKAKKIRSAVKEQEGTAEAIAESLAKKLKNKNFPKKRRTLAVMACMVIPGALITDFVWNKHRQGKLISQVEEKVAGSQIPGILTTTEEVRRAVTQTTSGFPVFAKRAESQGAQWLSAEAASGQGPGYFGKQIVMEGNTGALQGELSRIKTSSNSAVQRTLASQIGSETQTFSGGDANTGTGFVREFSQIATDLQEPGKAALQTIDTLTEELLEMENSRKFNRKRIIEIVNEMGRAVVQFGNEISAQQVHATNTARIYTNFIKKINTLVNNAYVASATRQPTNFAPDTNLPTIDASELIQKLQAQVPEFKYYSPDEIDDLMADRNIFTEAEANYAKNWALGWGIGVEILLRAIAFFGAGLLAKSQFAKNLTPEDHIKAEQSFDNLVEIFTAATESDMFKTTYPQVKKFNKTEVREVIMELMETWTKRRRKQESKKSNKIVRFGRFFIKKPLVGIKDFVSKVRPDQDQELELLREGISAIAASDNPEVLDRGFVQAVFEKLLGNPGDATELAGKLEHIQAAMITRKDESSEEPTLMTHRERNEMEESQEGVLSGIQHVQQYTNSTKTRLIGSHGTDVQEITEWAERIDTMIEAVQAKIPNDRSLSESEQRSLIGCLQAINTHITAYGQKVDAGQEDVAQWADTSLGQISSRWNLA